MTSDWMATKYHIHADFGTITLQFKQTPDNKLVVRAWSKYSYVVLGEDYVRDGNGNPIEFRTGTYTGDTAYEYHGQTLNNGDLYENRFVISKAKAVSGKGFVTRVWVNDNLGLEVYDPNILGGEGKFSHFLIDNISGTTITAYALSGIKEYRENAIAELEGIDLSKYSQTNAEKVLTLIAEAKITILGLNFIADINEFKNDTLEKIDGIWTKEREEEFASKKEAYISALTNIVSNGSYGEAESETVQALLSEAKTVIESATEADGFVKLSAIYGEYYAKISAVSNNETQASVATARVNAKEILESLISQFNADDYTSENFAKLSEIKERYEAMIDASLDVSEINALPYLAQSEIWGVETKAETALRELKTSAKATLLTYKNQAQYLAQDWEIIQAILKEANNQIDLATDATAIESIVAEAKSKMDKVSLIGDENKVPSGESSNREPSDKTPLSGCGSTIEGWSIYTTLLFVFVFLVFNKKNKANGEENE
jgi:hypothetical protein